MTFPARETSEEQGEPISLYRFIYSGTIADSPAAPSYNYTDAVVSVVEPVEGLTYTPTTIISDNLKSGGDADQSFLELRVPGDSTIADLFIVWPPSQPIILRIRNGHVGETEFPVRWSGRVTACKWEDNEAILTCESIATSLGRPGLRRRWTVGCPYALYDANTCKANEAAATITVAVQAIASTILTFTAGWHGGVAAAKFNGGKISWTDGSGVLHIRSILSAGATDVRISGLTTGLAALDNVDISLGCNRQESDCVNLHNNLLEYGGQLFLPTENPFAYVNRFY